MAEEMKLAQLLPLCLDRVHRLVRKTVRQEIHRKVGVPELRIIDFIALRMINRHPGLTIKELSTRLGVAQSTTSGMVDRYERLKMVKKAVNTDDRRSYRLYLAEASEAVMKEVMKMVTDDLFATLITLLSASEKEALELGLHGLLRAADEQLVHFAEDSHSCN